VSRLVCDAEVKGPRQGAVVLSQRSRFPSASSVPLPPAEPSGKQVDHGRGRLKALQEHLYPGERQHDRDERADAGDEIEQKRQEAEHQRQLQCVSCRGYFYETDGPIFYGKRF
jgi:hypothetical protein